MDKRLKKFQKLNSGIKFRGEKYCCDIFKQFSKLISEYNKVISYDPGEEFKYISFEKEEL